MTPPQPPAGQMFIGFLCSKCGATQEGIWGERYSAPLCEPCNRAAFADLPWAKELVAARTDALLAALTKLRTAADDLLAEATGQGGTYGFTRDNLRDALKVADAALARAKGGGG